MQQIFSPDSLIGVAGAGTMGNGIALVAATAGHPVVLFDPFPESLEKAKNTLQQTHQKLVEKGKLSAEKSAAILASITYTDDC